ncbi:MAG: DUF2490 domain-containing protein, partial [Bacteroidota bacterium]
MRTTKCLVLLSIFLFSSFHSNIVAQDGVKFWAGHSLGTKLTESWRIRVGQLYLFDEVMDLSSMQNSARIEYRFNRKFRIGLGYIRSSDPTDPDQEARNRLDPRIRYSFRIGKLRVANTLRTEWHFPERSKFEYRIRYALRLHRGDWGLPLNITPYVTNELHYYLDGRPFQYRNPQGEAVVKQSPDGLHAHRITLGLRFKPFKRANASIYFMRQTEFNLGNKYRRINVTDPRNGEVKRDFNNFSVLAFNF